MGDATTCVLLVRQKNDTAPHELLRLLRLTDPLIKHGIRKSCVEIGIQILTSSQLCAQHRLNAWQLVENGCLNGALQAGREVVVIVH